MFITISEAEGEVGIPLRPPVIFYITDRFKAKLLILFSLFDCFNVSLYNVSPSVSLDNI